MHVGGLAVKTEITKQDIKICDAISGDLKNFGLFFVGIDIIDNFKIERFICSHAIMFSFVGFPAIFIHSLLGTENDYAKLNDPSKYRAINRYQWQKKELFKES